MYKNHSKYQLGFQKTNPCRLQRALHRVGRKLEQVIHPETMLPLLLGLKVSWERSSNISSLHSTLPPLHPEWDLGWEKGACYPTSHKVRMFHCEATECSGSPHDAKGIIFKEVRAGVKETVLPRGSSGRGKALDPRRTDSTGGLSFAGPVCQNFPLRPPWGHRLRRCFCCPLSLDFTCIKLTRVKGPDSAQPHLLFILYCWETGTCDV